MSAFKIEVAQGCVKTWSKTFAHEPTVQNVIDAIKADPKSFKGEPDLCDYRMKPEDEPLTLDTKLQSGKVFAKKRDGKKSAVSSSSVLTSSKKKQVEDVLEIDVPETSSGLVGILRTGATLGLIFRSKNNADRYLESMCSEFSINLGALMAKKEKEKKKLRADKLRAELAELEADEEGSNHAGFTGSSSSSEGEEIDIEDIDEDDVKKEVPKKDAPKKDAPKTLKQMGLARGIFVDFDQSSDPVADEPVAAVAKSKSSKKGSK